MENKIILVVVCSIIDEILEGKLLANQYQLTNILVLQYNNVIHQNPYHSSIKVIVILELC